MSRATRVRAFVFLLGLAATLLLLEVSLRMVGCAVAWQHKPLGRGADGQYTVLCVGDSYTYGIGSTTGSSYPEQLERLLRSRFSRPVRVVNAGRDTQNSTELLRELPAYLEATRPNLVLVMSGGANGWKYTGYHERMKSGGFLAHWLDRLDGIRVYRLVKLVTRDLRRGSGSTATLTRGSGSPVALTKSGTRLLDGSAARQEPAIRKKLGPRYYRFCLYRTMGKIACARRDFWLALQWFLDALALQPGFNQVYLDVGVVYEELTLWERATLWYQKVAARFPDEPEVHRYLLRVPLLQGRHDVARRDVSRVVGRLPSLRPILEDIRSRQGLSDDDWTTNLCQWVTKDLAGIVRLCKESGAQVVLQCYPAFGPTDLVREVAEQVDAPCVDHCAVFLGLLQQGVEERDLFAPDQHCNNRGYGVMADNLLQYIVAHRLIE